MRPVYASVFLDNGGALSTTLAQSPNLFSPVSSNVPQAFGVLCSPTDNQNLTVECESSPGVVSPKANTFGFVVPRRGVYKVCGTYAVQPTSQNWDLYIAKNDNVVAKALHYDRHADATHSTLSVEHIFQCNEGDKFTFHLATRVTPYPTNTMINVDAGITPLFKLYHYFSLHNVD